MAAGVTPVFFKLKDVPNVSSDRPLSVLEVCIAAEKSAGQGTIVGAQLIGGLWRVYPTTREARSLLLVQGLRVRGILVQLKNTNPFILKDESGEEKPSTKIWIDNIPMSVADSEIEHSLLKAGCELRSQIKAERARDADNKLTRFLTGRRFVFATVPSVPLDKNIRVSVFNAKIYHKEQKLVQKTVVCSRCLEVGHHASTCSKDIVCRACKKPGHKRGDAECDIVRADKRMNVVVSANSEKEGSECSGENVVREKQSKNVAEKTDSANSRGRSAVRQTTLRQSMQFSSPPRRRSETPKRRRSQEMSSPTKSNKKAARQGSRIADSPPPPDPEEGGEEYY